MARFLEWALKNRASFRELYTVQPHCSVTEHMNSDWRFSGGTGMLRGSVTVSGVATLCQGIWYELWPRHEGGCLLTNPRHSQSTTTGTIRMATCAGCAMQDQKTLRGRPSLQAQGPVPSPLTASSSGD